MLIKNLVSLGSLLSLSLMLPACTVNLQDMADQYRQDQGDPILQPEGCPQEGYFAMDISESGIHEMYWTFLDKEAPDPYSLEGSRGHIHDNYCVDLSRKLIHRQVHYSSQNDSECGGKGHPKDHCWTKPFNKIINGGSQGNLWGLYQYGVTGDDLIYYWCDSSSTTHCTGEINSRIVAKRVMSGKELGR